MDPTDATPDTHPAPDQAAAEAAPVAPAAASVEARQAAEEAAPAAAPTSETHEAAPAAPAGGQAAPAKARKAKPVDPAEVERRRAQTAERVRRFREKHGGKGIEKKPAEEKAPELSAKDEKNLERDVKSIIDALWLLASWLVLPFGRELDDLTEAELGDGTRAWMPVARRHPWLVATARWLTAPLWLVMTVKRKIRLRQASQAAKKAPPPAAPAPPAAVTEPVTAPVTLRVVPSPNPAAAALAAHQASRAAEDRK